MSMRTRPEKAYFDTEYTTRQTLRRLASYAFRQRRMLTLLFVLLISNSLLAIILPFLVRNGLNELESIGDIDFEFVKQIGWIYLVGTILEWIIFYFQFKTQWVVTARSISDLRIEMFDKLQEMDLTFYDKMQTGKIMNRVMDDSNQAGSLINIFATFLSSLSLIGIMITILLTIQVGLTLLILAIFPGMIAAVFLLIPLLRRFSREVRRTRAAVNAAVQESVTGVSVAKGFNREEKNRVEFVELNKVNLRAGLRLSYTFTVFFPLIDFVSVLVLFMILNNGGRIVIDSASTFGFGIGDLFLFYSYTIRLFGPIIQVATQVAQIQAGSAATERIFSLIDLESNMKYGSDRLEKVEGEIEFDDVSFYYVEGQPIYENLSITIPKGQNVALVGHTGAGKTTMVSLLARFYEIQAGEIKVDGTNVQSIDIESYREHLGIVLQEPYLFSGTIEENIKYGTPNASEEDVQRAIKLTHLDQFIDSLPEGLQTDVRERGSRLSLGQRQLVTFARALVADPSILILDEATASVDAYTESLIQIGLENLFSGRTSIVVAHRLSTIINADRILVFDHGKIVADGPHNELMKISDTYRDLYSTYYEFQGVAPTIE